MTWLYIIQRYRVIGTFREQTQMIIRYRKKNAKIIKGMLHGGGEMSQC